MAKNINILIFLSIFVAYTSAQPPLGRNILNNVRVGPIVKQSHGTIWPKPHSQIYYPNQFLIVENIEFLVSNNTCDIIEQAIERYQEIIATTLNAYISNFINFDRVPGDKLSSLTIMLNSPCEYFPYQGIDESYELSVGGPNGEDSAQLVSNSVWGILRGLESFSQLLFWNGESVQINSTFIEDRPRFPFRSLLLDSSRHFLRKEAIFDNLDLMAMSKLNVLHWHLSDNEAFPFKSEVFPNLSLFGSFHPVTHEYTKDDIREIIEYARLRGIRVIPEFDTPGHTQSWGPGQPGLLTVCYDNETGEPNGLFGHVDPTNEENYVFFKDLFREVLDLFPEKYIHLGGDEVDEKCWASNPRVVEFMEEKGFGDDYTLLEDYHMSRMVQIIKELSPNSTQIGWQEVFFNNEAAAKDMIVHIWILEELPEQLFNVTEAGYQLLLGSCWYLDHISYGVDWHKYYLCDPHDFDGTEEQKNLVLGGGPNMWAEYIDETNLIPLLWPRASVPAERLWSPIHVNDTAEAAPRLEEFRCKLLRRGYAAQPPNGAGFCS